VIVIASVIIDHPGQRWIDGDLWETAENIAEEVPVALVYNGISHAVMMATPQDLEDFALGVSLTEGTLQSPRELLDCAELYVSNGIRMELTITSERFSDLHARRRVLGDIGVSRPLRPVNMKRGISSAAIYRATANLPRFQVIDRQVHATHAAAWATRDGTLAGVREDVGRHNALDKLIGMMARGGIDPEDGFALITGRCSFEMVQKAVAIGIGVLVAVAGPTALAVRTAESSRLTLIGWARGPRYTVYAHPQRVLP